MMAVHQGTPRFTCRSSRPCCIRPFGNQPPRPKEARDGSRDGMRDESRGGMRDGSRDEVKDESGEVDRLSEAF